MSQGQGGGPSEGNGPPDERGSPAHARGRRAQRKNDGTIQVGNDAVDDLAEQVDWSNLTPFEAWVVAVLDDNGLLD